MSDVTVTLGSDPKRQRVPGVGPVAGLSPASAGLLYGGAVAALAGGPLGLLAGLGVGIVTKKLRKNFLDHEAATNESLRVEHGALKEQIGNELAVADPDEARILQHAQRLADDGWERLMNGDESGRAMVEQANNISLDIMKADSQQRKQEAAAQATVQRSLVSTAANDYRNQFQQNRATYEGVNAQADRVLDLVAQKDFDPNKPFNKAILADLLSTGVNGFYKDAPDMLDAVAEGSGALGQVGKAIPGGAAIGTIVGAITTAFKAQDFHVSREDYNRIALNMKKFAGAATTAQMQRLGSQAQTLDAYAKKLGVIASDYSLGQYISGGVDRLDMTAPPSTETVPQSTQRQIPTRQLGTQWQPQQNTARPTN